MSAVVSPYPVLTDDDWKASFLCVSAFEDPQSIRIPADLEDVKFKMNITSVKHDDIRLLIEGVDDERILGPMLHDVLKGHYNQETLAVASVASGRHLAADFGAVETSLGRCSLPTKSRLIEFWRDVGELPVSVSVARAFAIRCELIRNPAWVPADDADAIPDPDPGLATAGERGEWR
jgi:hypothetical protein